MPPRARAVRRHSPKPRPCPSGPMGNGQLLSLCSALSSSCTAHQADLAGGESRSSLGASPRLRAACPFRRISGIESVVTGLLGVAAIGHCPSAVRPSEESHWDEPASASLPGICQVPKALCRLVSLRQARWGMCETCPFPVKSAVAECSCWEPVTSAGL